MADTEITVWLNEHRMEALEEQLALQGSSVEEHLQDYLIDLYAEMVPHEEQQRINNTLAEEAKADAEVREANRRFRVFRIMEGGSEALMAAEGNMDMLKTAQDLRAYVKSPPNRLGFYSTIIGHHFITEEEYSDAVAERMDNTGRVVGAYEIDLDNGEFSALHIMDGWKTFHVTDICSAAYRAMRKEYASWDDRWERFLSALDGKELTGSDMVQEIKGTHRLQPDEMCFEEEVIESEGKLNFYMPVIFDAHKIFGTQINDLDSINVYASYEMNRHCTDTALEIVGFKSDAQDVHYRYLLTKSERAVLEQKMEAYCQQRYGQSLEELCQEQREEMAEPQFGSM